MSAKSSVLYAAAKEIGSTCAAVNEQFLECKAVDEDPAACLKEGEAVQGCALRVLKSAMETCGETFQSYANCIDKQISEEYMFERCRKFENDFKQCRADAAADSNVVAVASAAEPTSERDPQK